MEPQPPLRARAAPRPAPGPANRARRGRAFRRTPRWRACPTARPAPASATACTAIAPTRIPRSSAGLQAATALRAQRPCLLFATAPARALRHSPRPARPRLARQRNAPAASEAATATPTSTVQAGSASRICPSARRALAVPNARAGSASTESAADQRAPLSARRAMGPETKASASPSAVRLTAADRSAPAPGAPARVNATAR